VKDKVTLYFGPPGTGKTTTLLNELEELLEAGVSPNTIGFVSFTRAASNEATERACQRFSLDAEDFPYFRTLHSFCYNQLDLTRENVFHGAEVFRFAKLAGVPISVNSLDPETGMFSGGDLRGDRLFHLEYLSRTTLRSLREVWQEEEGVSWSELEKFKLDYDEYKKNRGLYDFTDMLSAWVEGGYHPPRISHLFLDESQDFTPLQWRVTEKIRAPVSFTYICGDDDQALFTWNGADPSLLANFPATKTVVLSQSYRVPRTIHSLAYNISSRISKRADKPYLSAPREGTIKHISSIASLPLQQNGTGSWLLLARNVVFLEYFLALCIDRGIPFDCRHSPLREGCRAAIATHRLLLMGGYTTAATVVDYLLPFLPSRVRLAHGAKRALAQLDPDTIFTRDRLEKDYGFIFKERWEDFFLLFTEEERIYYREMARHGGGLGEKSRIRISTVHGAKGAEADNVCFMRDMTRKTHEKYLVNPDPEHRVAYVAVTRARENLYLLQPQSDKYYEL
jgi:DNA helicase-2/ATP-dependent DNA helicase PcrA